MKMLSPVVLGLSLAVAEVLWPRRKMTHKTAGGPADHARISEAYKAARPTTSRRALLLRR